MKQVPVIMQGPLTGTWYCVTKYRHFGKGNIVALEKFDVNQQIEAILKADRKSRNKPKRKPRP